MSNLKPEGFFPHIAPSTPCWNFPSLPIEDRQYQVVGDQVRRVGIRKLQAHHLGQKSLVVILEIKGAVIKLWSLQQFHEMFWKKEVIFHWKSEEMVLSFKKDLYICSVTQFMETMNITSKGNVWKVTQKIHHNFQNLVLSKFWPQGEIITYLI